MDLEMIIVLGMMLIAIIGTTGIIINRINHGSRIGEHASMFILLVVVIPTIAAVTVADKIPSEVFATLFGMVVGVVSNRYVQHIQSAKTKSRTKET